MSVNPHSLKLKVGAPIYIYIHINSSVSVYCSASLFQKRKNASDSIVNQVICVCNNLIIICDNQQPIMDIPDVNDIMETHIWRWEYCIWKKNLVCLLSMKLKERQGSFSVDENDNEHEPENKLYELEKAVDKLENQNVEMSVRMKTSTSILVSNSQEDEDEDTKVFFYKCSIFFVTEKKRNENSQNSDNWTRQKTKYVSRKF